MPEVVWAHDPLHWRVLLVGSAAALVAGVAAGLVPALQSVAPDLTKALKAGARDGGTPRSRLRDFLVASQAALCVILVVGAVLFVRSLQNARARDIGYSVDRLAFASVESGSDQAARHSVSSRLVDLQDRLAAIPGVEQVEYTSMRPMWGIQFESYFPESETRSGSFFGFYSEVSPGFFDATGTRILRGRTFATGAAGRAERAVLVNQALVDSLWPNQDPLGRCIRFKEQSAPCYAVIGVTQTALLTRFGERPEPKVYVPLSNTPIDNSWGVGDVVLRMDPRRMTSGLAHVRDLLRAEFPGLAVQTSTMASAMEPEYRPWVLGATLFTLFGILAAIVAAIGVYSSVSYAVSQRTFEFGVRVALGARRRTIIRQVVWGQVRVVAAGVAAGVLMSLALGRIVESLLYGIEPANPAPLLVASVLLVAVAAAASLAPALRAGRADPVTALRTD
jgi:predicted permease